MKEVHSQIAVLEEKSRDHARQIESISIEIKGLRKSRHDQGNDIHNIKGAFTVLKEDLKGTLDGILGQVKQNTDAVNKLYNNRAMIFGGTIAIIACAGIITFLFKIMLQIKESL